MPYKSAHDAYNKELKKQYARKAVGLDAEKVRNTHVYQIGDDCRRERFYHPFLETDGFDPFQIIFQDYEYQGYKEKQSEDEKRQMFRMHGLVHLAQLPRKAGNVGINDKDCTQYADK
jgi:hypothetical protein